MNNEVINNVTEKIVFTTGEKIALSTAGVGLALIGYGVGSFIVEPIVKKAASGISGLFKGKEKKDIVEDEKEVKEEVKIIEEKGEVTE